jgi:hypothetical protein
MSITCPFRFEFTVSISCGKNRIISGIYDSQDLIKMFKHPMNREVTKEQLLEIAKEKIEELEESIEKESLILLKQQLLEPTLNPAIVKGLLENIRTHRHCKWISCLLRNYFEF